MKHTLIAIILILLSLPLLAAGEWSQYYFRFELQDKAQIANITKIISIDNVKGNWVYAYANDWEWAEFNKLGYRAQILPAPASEYPAIMSSSQSQLRLWDSYPTYDAYVAMMYAFQTNYPNLCQIIDAGTTVGGRKILFAKISDNVTTHEKEPEVMYSSSMHGDEITGYVLMLRLIDTMLSQYSTDTRIANLVNNMEIYINPDANPDGTYYGGNSSVSGARRANQNGYDLNRNFPNFDGSTNTGPIQPETTLFMNFANAHRFVLSANFHGGAEVVNYPWDYTYTLHPDNSWWLSTSLVYANSVQAHGPTGYFTGISSNGVTNGAAWYVVAGGRQDWHNYGAHGRELCIELSNTKLPAASTLPTFWNSNYDAFLAFLEQAQYGVYGTVQDINGNPLQASIYAVGIDTSYTYVTTDPLYGDFYRFLSPGNYTLQVSTSGYADKTVNVTVTAGQKTPVTVIFGGVEPPTLAFGTMTISDPSPGNANGRLDPGETVTLTMPLNNTGGTASPAGSATLTCATTGITVNTGTANFSAISAAGSTNLSFSITAASSMSIGTVASLDFNATAGAYTATKTESVPVGLITETFETGNFTSYPWVMGTTPWVISATLPHTGTYCAKSGTITASGSTTMETTRILSASGTLSFWYKVSSESGYDFLKFYIDGTEQNSWSGTVDWTQASYTLAAGTHVLKWEYMKDTSVDFGSDCGWVDDIVFPASTSPSLFYPPQNFAASPGNTVVNLTWAVPASGTPTGYKIFKNSSLLTTVTGLNYSDTAVTNGTTYAYYMKAVYTGGESDPTATINVTPNNVTSVIIGTGTSSNANNTACPVNVYYQSLHGQSVYTAAELTAAGVVGPINITQIGFNVTGLPGVAMPNFIVRMGHTASVNVSSWIPSTSMSTVYTATSYQPATTGWNMLTLSTPFLWNGTGNIVIDTAFGLIGSYSQTGTTQYSTVTSGYRYVRNDSVDERTIFTAGSTSTNRPNVKLTLVPNAVGPLMTVAPTTLTYGNVAVGANSVLPFTIQNTGDQQLTGSIVTPAGYTVAEVTGRAGLSATNLTTGKATDRNTIGFTVNVGVTKTYNVTFAPTAAVIYTGNVAITSNAATNPNVNVSASGTGYVPPTISLDTSAISLTRYTNQTGTANFTISNTGTQAMTYTVTESPAVAWYSASPVSGSVAGSGNQSITGTFTSVGLAPGVYTTTLNVASNDALHPTLQVAVQLTVQNTAPTIDIPASYAFDENTIATTDFASCVNDIDGQTLTLGYSGNTNFLVQITGFSVQFSAPQDWVGSEEITFSVFDGTAYAYDTMTVTVYLVYLPQPPINVVVETENGVSMGWAPVPNAQYYKIYRALEPYGTYEYIGDTTSTNFEDWGLNPAAFYKIVAVSDDLKK